MTRRPFTIRPLVLSLVAASGLGWLGAAMLRADDKPPEAKPAEGQAEAKPEEAKPAEPPAPAAPEITTFDRWVTSVSVSGNLLATGGGDSLMYRPGDVKLWDLSSGALLATLEGHGANVWSVALSPDAKTLVSTGYDGKILVWDVDSKQQRSALEKKGWCRSVAFAPDGVLFATAHEDGNVTLWKTADGSEVRTIKAHEAQVFQVAFSRDGKQLATASADKTVKLLGVDNGEEQGKLEGAEDALWTVAYGADGRIAAAGADRKIRVWKDGQVQATLEGHKDWVSQIAFSPSGELLAAADQGHNIKLWDVASGAEGGNIGPLGGSQWAVAFNADGSQLVTGGRKDSIRVWDVAPRKIWVHSNHFPPPAPAAAEPPKAEEKPAEEKPAEAPAEEKKE